MNLTLIYNVRIINEGSVKKGAVVIKNDLIGDIIYESEISDLSSFDLVIDGKNNYLIPGVIDDQVHFREPGLTHKADIFSESRAAAAGGITSFMEMPNTNPPTISNSALEEKFRIASENSLVNYSFYLGATNDNLDELLAIDKNNSAGIKIFMGSSTGNMLVDDKNMLDKIFSKCKTLIATHCEDEQIIQHNISLYREKFGENVPINYHPNIRSREACLKCTKFAVNLAAKHDTRLHILHLSTAEETDLFNNDRPSIDKLLTTEVCVHHLWFDDRDYDNKGTFIKWNPAIKTLRDKEQLLKALIDSRIDIIATDHAPHTLAEKNNSYFKAPSGGPLVQHALPAMFELYHQGLISPEIIIDKMCHKPAEIFKISNRGFIRKGYFADLVLINLDAEWKVDKTNILYKCGWSPFEGTTFHSKVLKTFVNGKMVYDEQGIKESKVSMPLKFNR